jgi:hypothetical protein
VLADGVGGVEVGVKAGVEPAAEEESRADEVIAGFEGDWEALADGKSK